MLLHVAQDAGDFTEEQHAAVARRLEFLYPLSQAPELILLLAKQDQGAVAATAVAGNPNQQDQNEAQCPYQHTRDNFG